MYDFYRKFRWNDWYIEVIQEKWKLFIWKIYESDRTEKMKWSIENSSILIYPENLYETTSSFSNAYTDRSLTFIPIWNNTKENSRLSHSANNSRSSLDFHHLSHRTSNEWLFRCGFSRLWINKSFRFIQSAAQSTKRAQDIKKRAANSVFYTGPFYTTVLWDLR